MKIEEISKSKNGLQFFVPIANDTEGPASDWFKTSCSPHTFYVEIKVNDLK